MKRILFFLFLLNCSGSFAEDYFISQPLSINPTGCNKVLCMKNGHTLLFHFEPERRILVKVFDSAHKEIASRKDRCRYLDDFTIEYASFKGLFEINGEAVLFIDQDERGKHILIRLRYNGTTGELTDESLVGESKNENRRIQYFVMKNKNEDSYEILFCMDKRHPKQSDIFLVYFDSVHKALKELPINVSRKRYDFLQVLGAESQPGGVLITLGLDKTITYGGALDLSRDLFAHPDHDSAFVPGASVYDHYLSYYYIPSDSSGMKAAIIHLAEDVYPYFTLYTYNPFADKLNLLVYSNKPLYYQFGLQWRLGSISNDLLFSIDKYDMSAKLNMVKNALDDFSVDQKDTAKPFQGVPVRMFTNENGLSTIISQACVKYGEPETADRFNYEEYFNSIGITQCDDVGNELWSTVLPLAQYYKSYRNFYNEKDLAKRWQDQVLMDDLPDQVYQRQFVSFNAYNRGRNFYIIYNDYDKNFDKSVRKRGDTVFSFGSTDACYYKLDQKKNVSKHYLFDTPAHGDHRCSFIEGADYDENRGVYATLVQQRRGNKITLRMAWKQLD